MSQFLINVEIKTSMFLNPIKEKRKNFSSIDFFKIFGFLNGEEIKQKQKTKS